MVTQTCMTMSFYDEVSLQRQYRNNAKQNQYFLYIDEKHAESKP